MIKIYVMQTCPDCTQVKKVATNDPRVQLIDIGEHVKNLKEFLQLRDQHPKFAVARERGLVGIPAFVSEDGRIYFHAEEVGLDLRKEEDIQTGATCSIDGKGC